MLYPSLCTQAGLVKASKDKVNISQPRKSTFPLFAKLIKAKITIGGINRLIVLLHLDLRRTKLIVAAAKVRKVIATQGAALCNLAIHMLSIKNSFPVPSDNNQLNITGMGANISEA